MPARESVGDERLGAERVVAVTVRIDEKRERLVADLANRAHRHRAHQPGAGIDDDHLAAPVCERDVGEAVEVVRSVRVGRGTHGLSPSGRGSLTTNLSFRLCTWNEG